MVKFPNFSPAVKLPQVKSFLNQIPPKSDRINLIELVIGKGDSTVATSKIPQYTGSVAYIIHNDMFNFFLLFNLL